jgi:hypothetical protein
LQNKWPRRDLRSFNPTNGHLLATICQQHHIFLPFGHSHFLQPPPLRAWRHLCTAPYLQIHFMFVCSTFVACKILGVCSMGKFGARGMVWLNLTLRMGIRDVRCLIRIAFAEQYPEMLQTNSNHHENSIENSMDTPWKRHENAIFKKQSRTTFNHQKLQRLIKIPWKHNANSINKFCLKKIPHRRRHTRPRCPVCWDRLKSLPQSVYTSVHPSTHPFVRPLTIVWQIHKRQYTTHKGPAVGWAEWKHNESAMKTQWKHHDLPPIDYQIVLVNKYMNYNLWRVEYGHKESIRLLW